MLATDSQRTVASENRLSGRGGFQRDRFRLGSPVREDNVGVTPLTLAQDQIVAGLRLIQRRLQCGDVADRNILGE